MSKSWLRKFIGTVLLLGVMTTHLPALAQTSLDFLATKQETSSQALKIITVSHNVSNRSIDVGETLTITIEGTEKVRASILILGDKQQIREYRAKETTPGVYVVNLIVSQRDRVTEGAIIARLQKGTNIVYGAATQPFAVNPRNREGIVSASSPVTQKTTNNNSVMLIPIAIISHQNGERVANKGFKIMGQTEPNAEVQIKIASAMSLIGNLMQIEGETLIDRIINADNRGNFAITVPQNLNAPQGLQYLISAIAFSKNGQSRTLELTLIQK